jgi:hypothetical protein
MTLAEIELNAQKCCDGILNFTFGQFEKEFFPDKIEVIDLKTTFASYAAELRKREQIVTAISCEVACNSLHRYRNKISLEHQTPEFPGGYER